MDHHIVGLIAAAFLLLLTFSAVWRSKTWYGVLTGSEPLYFSDLPNLFPRGQPVQIQEAPSVQSFPELQWAKQLLGAGVSVIYYRSQYPKGIIETMDIWAQGKRGRLLRFEAETCVGYAGIGPNPLFRVPSPEAAHYANLFANEARKLVLEQTASEPS